MQSLFRSTLRAFGSSAKTQIARWGTARTANFNASKRLTKNGKSRVHIPSFTFCHLGSLQRRSYSLNEGKSNQQISIDPDDGLQLLSTNPKEALKIFNNLQNSAATSKDNERILYGKGYALAKLGRYQEALYTLDYLSAINPKLSLVLKGQIHFAQKNYELAAKLYEHAAEIFPNDASILSALAHVYMNMDRKIDALNALIRAYELDPNNERIANWITACCLKLGPGFEVDAYNCSEYAVRLNPEDPMLLYNFSQSCCRIGEFEQAKRTFEKIFTLKNVPDQAIIGYAKLLLLMNEYDEAEKYLLISAEVEMPKATTLLRALYLFQHRFEDARKVAERVSRKFPLDPNAWCSLGRSWLPNNVDRAMKYFQQALNIDNSHDLSNDGMACCLFLKGQIDQALQHLAQATYIGGNLATVSVFEEATRFAELVLQKQPDQSAKVYESLEYIYTLKKDYAKEFEFYTKRLEVSSNRVDKTYLLLLRNDFDNALKMADELLATDALIGLDLKARIMLEMGHTKEAIKLIRHYQRENPNEMSMSLLELFMTALSRDNDSLDEVEDVCRRFPSNYAANMALSEVYRRRGDYHNAMKCYERAQTIKGSSPRYIFPTSFPMRYSALKQCAMILESMGDVEGAIKEYTNVLSINSNDLWSIEHLAMLKNKTK